jgi:hypothetical protein
VVALRRPRLPVVRPRKLSPAEAAALKARPWPRLPWWLWLVVTVTVVAMVAVGLALVLRAPPRAIQVPLAARRSPPVAGLSHGVGQWRAPALEAATAGRAVTGTVECPRLAGLRLAGTNDDVALLRLAADQVCALRSEGGIDEARSALQRAGAVVAFAGFTASGNESTTLLDPSPGLVLGRSKVAVLVNGKFAGGRPERVAALLVHEGAHLAGRPAGSPGWSPSAADELAARRTELAACGRLFAGPGAAEANRGCQDARDLLALGEPAALAALRAAGYR